VVVGGDPLISFGENTNMYNAPAIFTTVSFILQEAVDIFTASLI
jgi:hypothetical protein